MEEGSAVTFGRSETNELWDRKTVGVGLGGGR